MRDCNFGDENALNSLSSHVELLFDDCDSFSIRDKQKQEKESQDDLDYLDDLPF